MCQSFETIQINMLSWFIKSSSCRLIKIMKDKIFIRKDIIAKCKGKQHLIKKINVDAGL